MIKVFTQDKVIRYVYHEISPFETLEIEQALLFDDELQETYKGIAGVVHELDKIMKSPSQLAVSNILRYAKMYKRTHS